MSRIIDGREYFAQFLQDYFLNELVFKNKRNGTFIEFGAYDGIKYSNTNFFEKELNWRGVCIEPVPSEYAKLNINRNCHCLFGAVIPDYKQNVNLVLADENNIFNSCVEGSSGNLRCKSGKVIEVPAYNINTVLGTFELYELDYLSIDIEGDEIDIVKSIDLKKYDIKVITVENNDNSKDIYDYLLKNGYRYFNRLFIDDLFIRI